jgi:hypothetical protein
LNFGIASPEKHQTMTTKFTKSIHCLFSSKDQLEYLRWRLAIRSLNHAITIRTDLSEKSCEAAVVLVSKAFLQDEKLLSFCRSLISKLSGRLSIYKIESGVEVPDDLNAFVEDSFLFLRKISISNSSEGSSEILKTDLPQSSGLLSDSSMSSVILDKEIGRGQFGKAFLAECGNQKVVAKQINLVSEVSTANRFDQAVSILNEIMISERVSGHPNTGKRD